MCLIDDRDVDKYTAHLLPDDGVNVHKEFSLYTWRERTRLFELLNTPEYHPSHPYFDIRKVMKAVKTTTYI